VRLRHLPILTFLLLTVLALRAQEHPVSERAAQRIRKEVGHEPSMLSDVTADDTKEAIIMERYVTRAVFRADGSILWAR
jgi:hypothetical protein